MSLKGCAHETTCWRDMNRTCRIALKLSPKLNQPKANFNPEATLVTVLKYTCTPFVHSTNSEGSGTLNSTLTTQFVVNVIKVE